MESDFDDTILNEDIDDLLDDESPELSNDDGAAALDTSNLGLEIVSTFSCADSVVDELINSPVKNSKLNIMTKDDSATISEDVDTDAVESNLIQEIGQPERLVTTPKDLQEETSPQKISTEVVLSVKNTIETIENVAGIENGNEKSRKPGPRSKTRPLEPPAVRDSPTKIKESIAENIKIFEKEAKSLEAIQSLKDTNVESKSLAGPETSSAAETVVVVPTSVSEALGDDAISSENIATEESIQPIAGEDSESTVRYRPGQSSREQYLVIKESDPIKES